MSTKILIIDDLRLFKESGHEFDITYARTASEGTALLKSGDWDTVFFDHDLGEHTTAIPCAKYVVEHSDNFRGTQFIVHTSNPYGGDTIVSMFKTAGLTVIRQAAPLWFSGVIDE
jgi:hypothetical protein